MGLRMLGYFLFLTQCTVRSMGTGLLKGAEQGEDRSSPSCPEKNFFFSFGHMAELIKYAKSGK